MDRYTFLIFLRSMKIDFLEYEKQPVKAQIESVGSFKLNNDRFQNLWIEISPNQVQTQDMWLQLGWYTHDFNFFSKHNINSYFNKRYSEDPLAQVQINISSTGRKHERRVYGYFDLLGDLGGVLEMVLVFFGFFINPVAEHSFIFKATNKLYLARTNTPGVFLEKPKWAKSLSKSKLTKQEVPENAPSWLKQEISKQKPIIVSFHNSLWVYFYQRVCLFSHNNSMIQSPVHKKLVKLFSISQKKIEKNLDILYIIRNLRNLKILSEKFMDQEEQFYVERNNKNVINLDTSEDEQQLEACNVAANQVQVAEMKPEEKLPEAGDRKRR